LRERPVPRAQPQDRHAPSRFFASPLPIGVIGASYVPIEERKLRVGRLLPRGLRIGAAWPVTTRAVIGPHRMSGAPSPDSVIATRIPASTPTSQGTPTTVSEPSSIIDVRCEMPQCYCFRGRRYFEPRSSLSAWSPTAGPHFVPGSDLGQISSLRPPASAHDSTRRSPRSGGSVGTAAFLSRWSPTGGMRS
jgi:hypothetical protein